MSYYRNVKNKKQKHEQMVIYMNMGISSENETILK